MTNKCPTTTANLAASVCTVMLAMSSAVLGAPGTWAVQGGSAIISNHDPSGDPVGVYFLRHGDLVDKTTDLQSGRTALVDRDSRMIARDWGDGHPIPTGDLRLLGGFYAETAGVSLWFDKPIVVVEYDSTWGFQVWIADQNRIQYPVMLLRNPRVELDALAGTLSIESDEVVFSRRAARRLGDVSLSGRSVATMVLRADLSRVVNEKAATTAESASMVAGTSDLEVTGTAVGPDVIVISLPSTGNFGMENGISAFSVATTSCNIGDVSLNWFDTSNQHPVIAQNLYRLKNDRFEQIGMSWVKHGFFAVNNNTSSCGTCQDTRGGHRLHPGCSDPYSAGLNGTRIYLGPRSAINAATGEFPYPPNRPSSSTEINGRLQVHNDDLDPVLNEGASYYLEGQYVTPDDAASNNDNNNASYIGAIVTPPNEDLARYMVRRTGSTVREKSAIRVWKVQDPSVVESDIHVPIDGEFILAAKVTDLRTGFWRYEYALLNYNSDRSGRAFSVPIPAAGRIIQNVGFHDVDYHSGEPYDLTDWPVTVGANSIDWATELYDDNPNANALRWSTLYNYRFEINAPPVTTSITLELFKPGPIDLVMADDTIGPATGLIDCDGNGLLDACDMDCGATDGPCDLPGCGTALDCDANGVPDRCEADCNENGFPDACDISIDLGGTSSDCNGNTIPDECEPDCDNDGITDDCDGSDFDGDGFSDCDDLCPENTPPGLCPCPERGTCTFGFIVLENWLIDDCIVSGGVPECFGSLCHDGCLVGDDDQDGDLDLWDFGAIQRCYSGPSNASGFVVPSDHCLFVFDDDEDGDVDAKDFNNYQTDQSGPTAP